MPSLPFHPLIIVAGILVAGVVSGVLLEWLLRRYVLRLVEKTEGLFDDRVARAFRGILFLWCVLAAVSLSLKIFPFPPELGGTFEKIITILFIVSFTVVGARVAGGLIETYAGRMAAPLTSTSIFRNIAYTVIYLLGLLMVFHALGISITPLITAMGVGGLAVALALQETLSNLFAGLHIIASRQVRVGDYVKLDTGEEGYVVDITWRNTTIRALPNNLIIVPNSRMASAVVLNYNLPQREMSVIVQVGVSYDSDLEKVEKVTIEVATDVMREVPGGVPEFQPFIRYHTFGDSSINFSVILRAKEFVDQYLIKHEFIKRLHARYREEGIEIPFPIRTVHMKNPPS